MSRVCVEKKIFSIGEVASKLGIKERTLKVYINKYLEHIEVIRIDNAIYLDEDECSRLIRNKESCIPYYVRIPEGYITTCEIDKNYKYKFKSIDTFLKNVKKIKIDKNYFLEEKSLKEWVSKFNDMFIEKYNLDSSDEWVRLCLVETKTKKGIQNLIREKRLKENEFREIYYGNKKEIYINKSVIDDVDRLLCYETMKRQSDREKRNIVKDIYDLSEIEQAFDWQINKLIEPRGVIKYELSDVSKIVDIRESKLIDIFNNELLKDYILSDNRIYEGGVIQLLRFRNYISIQEISSIMKMHQTTIYLAVNKNTIEEKIKKIIFKQHTYIKKNVAIELIKNSLKNKISNINDLNKILELRLNLIHTPFTNTVNIAKTYLKKEIERLKEKPISLGKTEFIRSINSIDRLIETLHKELLEYDNEDIYKLLINADYGSSYLVKSMVFINYVRKKSPQQCKYTKQIGMSVIKQLKEKDEPDHNKTYSEEQWLEYYIFLKDVDIHISKASKSERYAQVWLFCLLHLSITWRLRDIIDKVPNITLEVVGIYDAEWFNNNSFELNMAIKVLDSVAFALDGDITYKNQMNLHFNVPLSLKKPTAIALIVNEINRRKNEEKCIFYKLKVAHPTKKRDYESFFYGKPHLQNFSNLKATATLMTMNFATANRNPGMAGVAYTLGQYGRSHKDGEKRITNTTSAYFYFGNQDGSPADIAYQTIETGMFGYLYLRLIQLCLPENEIALLTQNEQKELIKNLRADISPLSIENLSASLLVNYNNRGLGVDIMNTVENINTIQGIPQKYIKDFLRNQLKNRYKEVAFEIFPDQSEELTKYIDKKVSFIDQFFNEHISSQEVALSILTDIKNAERSCLSYESNCLFDDLERKEKCPYNQPETCIGCTYNIMNTMQLYEVNLRLNSILNDMISNNTLMDIDLIRCTSLVENYLSIMIQAKTQFEELDKSFLSAFFDIGSIKLKIKKLKDSHKLLFPKLKAEKK